MSEINLRLLDEETFAPFLEKKSTGGVEKSWYIHERRSDLASICGLKAV